MLKYVTFHYNNKAGRRCMFGQFSTKKDAIRATKERFQTHVLVKDCDFVEVVRTSDHFAVFVMEATA